MTAAVMVMVLSGTAFHLIQISTEIHLTVTPHPPSCVLWGEEGCVYVCIFHLQCSLDRPFEELAKT